MNLDWFQSRGYSHFDVAVGKRFARQALRPDFVAKHSFSPLISYEKVTKRYRPKDKRVEEKRRPIMYASHRDACILSYYGHMLAEALEEFYKDKNITDNVIAYRRLGKSNYDFSGEALQYALSNYPCVVHAYDVTKFFDTLDHGLLKSRLKTILGVKELSPDWYSVFRHVTKFRHVPRTTLESHKLFGRRLNTSGRMPVATLAELKAAGIAMIQNPAPYGIPQGTPISSVLANLYLIVFDVEIAAHALEVGGFYRRYSDDILFICKEEHSAAAEAHIESTLAAERLKISAGKTERTYFDPSNPRAAQYLGFSMHPAGAAIRAGSMSRQWRKMRSAVKRTKRIGEASIADGSSSKIYTKKLRRRFTRLPLRNFSAYARRSAEALNSKQVLRQVRRLEREFAELMKGFR